VTQPHREQGTLINFREDGVLSDKNIKKLWRMGKVPIGAERTMIIKYKDLEAWGLIASSESDFEVVGDN
jgi:hypothetical protein